MALERLVQSQAMSIRNILVVGEERPLEAYTFDLAGGHPRTPADDPDAFYEDLMLRILTAVSTLEITQHQAWQTGVKRYRRSSLPQRRCVMAASSLTARFLH
jgi:hypothetical protein